jgi:hypothetical protein
LLDVDLLKRRTEVDLIWDMKEKIIGLERGDALYIFKSEQVLQLAYVASPFGEGFVTLWL